MHLLNPTNIADILATWGYLGIFLCVFAGNVGLPVPEETVVLAAGFLAGRDILELKMVYAVVVLSAISGDTCGFFIGRTGGQRLVERLAARFQFVRRRYERIQAFFEAHGSKAVFMARFIAGARFMAGPMAGAAGMSFWRFFGWNVLGAVIWCALMVGIGYMLVDELWRIAHLTHTAVAAQIGGLVIIAILIAVYFLWWRRSPDPAAGKSGS